MGVPSEKQECEVSLFTKTKLQKLSHRQKKIYITTVFLVIVIAVVLALLILQNIYRTSRCKMHDGEKKVGIPSMGSTVTETPGSEDTYYRCSPCELMSKTSDHGDIRYGENDDNICCKQMDKQNYKMVNKGNLLEECQRSDNSGNGDNPAMLLYYDISKPHCSCTEQAREGTLRWTVIKNTSAYMEGGVKHDTCTGEVTVPSSGLYGVYSYIQFDTYTLDTRMTTAHEHVYHTIYSKGSGRILQLNKFRLDKDSYICDQIGPIIVHLKAGEKLIVTTNRAKYIQRTSIPSTMFGLYKLR